MKRYTISFILSVLLISLAAQAHQPRIVEGATPVEVLEPEISKAYYGRLMGAPQLYTITADEAFDLYVGITVPDIPSATTDYSVHVWQIDGSRRLLFELDGTQVDWEPFFEPAGNDDYLSGPEQRMRVEAGMYEIIVSSPDNEGAYSLAVGEIESFPPGEIINAYRTIPRIKSGFFETSAFAAALSPFLAVPVILLGAVIALIIWLVRGRRNKA